MNTILAVGATHALYLAFLIFKREKKSQADILLSLLFISYGVELSLLFVSFEFNVEDLSIPLLNADLLVIPIFYLYTRFVTVPNRRLNKKDALYFIPYFLSTLYWLSLFLSTNEYELIQLFYHTPFSEKPMLFNMVAIIDIVLYPLFLILILFKQRKYQKMLLRNFSYTEGVNFSWINFLTTITLLEWGFALLFYLVTGDGEFDESSLQKSAAFSTIFIFIIGYYGLKQGYLYLVKEADILTESKKSSSDRTSITESEANHYAERLKIYMQKHKPYLNNTLSLSELAENSAMSRHTLSWVINEKLSSNFYSFINSYRVDEFKSKISDPQYRHFTILAVAVECGFNSKATFNRIFKQRTGLTPNQYIKTL